MIKLKCQCCNHEHEFKDSKEAFENGWDCEPYITSVITCELCPSSAVFLGIPDKDHMKQHDKWKTEGRPNANN